MAKKVKNKLAHTKYTEDMVFRVYELAKNGYKKTKIAEACGVTSDTLTKWFKAHPVCKKAYLKGKKLYASDSGQTTTFTDYVHDNLPKKILKKWDKIMILQDAARGPQRVQAFLEAQTKIVQQYLFIHSLISCNFQKAKALKKIGLTYSSLYRWQEDADFSTMLDFVHELRGDFFEDYLTGLIVDGDSKAIIFANRTFNRKRGYGDKLDVKIDHSIQHTHTISLADAGMTLEERKKVLNSIRTKRIESKVIDAEII